MLPDDCTDCPCCGVPMMRGPSYCDGCWNTAAARLKLKLTTNEHGFETYTDPKSGKDATWRVYGLLARWSRQ